jgi:hypothetical protein
VTILLPDLNKMTSDRSASVGLKVEVQLLLIEMSIFYSSTVDRISLSFSKA